MNFKPLTDFLDYYLPSIGVPGSDTVIYKDHKEVFRHQSGYDSLRFRTPTRPDALYNIYSCSKIATCVAVMQLIERGNILATDPLYAFMPEFRNVSVAIKDRDGNVIDTRTAKTPITIQHLFTMTSGFNYKFATPDVIKTVDSTGGRAPTVEICRALATAPLDFDPGEHYQYGYSHDILGAVVELVSGKRFSEYMKENVFLPLGMKDTDFHIESSKFARVACQYEYDPETRSARDLPAHQCIARIGCDFDSGGGGIVSSVDDYILLGDALANGGLAKNGFRLLSEYAVSLMSSNMLTSKPLADFASGLNLGYGYGCGVRVNIDPCVAGNLAPVGEFGWDGMRLSFMSCYPKGRIAIFHAEHMGGLHSLVEPRLRNVVYSCLGEM